MTGNGVAPGSGVTPGSGVEPGNGLGPGRGGTVGAGLGGCTGDCAQSVDVNATLNTMANRVFIYQHFADAGRSGRINALICKLTSASGDSFHPRTRPIAVAPSRFSDGRVRYASRANWRAAE